MVRSNPRYPLIVVAAAATLAIAFTPFCAQEESKTHVARIGTWNLEWFGALGRSDADITKLADIIRELNIDVLALQEITCPRALEKLKKELQRYDCFISPQRIPQKPALLWRTDRVEKVCFDEDAFEALRGVAVTGLDRESRQPLVFRMKIDEFDFTLMVVHLKSVPEAERSVRIRNVQYDSINVWLAKELGSPGADQDIIIAGDFNSFATGVSSERLVSAGHVKFTSANLAQDEYSNIWYDHEGNRNLSLVDHIVITAALEQGEFRLIEPIKDLDSELGADAYETRISDHLPVIAVFKTDRDLD